GRSGVHGSLAYQLIGIEIGIPPALQAMDELLPMAREQLAKWPPSRLLNSCTRSCAVARPGASVMIVSRASGRHTLAYRAGDRLQKLNERYRLFTEVIGLLRNSSG